MGGHREGPAPHHGLHLFGRLKALGTFLGGAPDQQIAERLRAFLVWKVGDVEGEPSPPVVLSLEHPALCVDHQREQSWCCRPELGDGTELKFAPGAEAALYVEAATSFGGPEVDWSASFLRGKASVIASTIFA